MTGWRPISEAPKDGTEIIALVEVSQFGERLHATRHLALYDEYAPGWADNNDGTLLEWQDHPPGQYMRTARVVGWMPLPPPPDAPGSPQLDQPTRSRHEAALDIAVEALRWLSDRLPEGPAKYECDMGLDKIAALVPEAVR